MYLLYSILLEGRGGGGLTISKLFFNPSPKVEGRPDATGREELAEDGF